MPQIAIQSADASDKHLPVFDEIRKRFEAVRERAFQLFETRGAHIGNELDDWLNAEKELAGWSAAELFDKDGAFEVRMALPGFDAKQVEVTATPGEILVQAKAEEEKKDTRENVVWTEFGARSIYRRFDLPKAIDAGKATASLDKGMLEVHAPQVGVPQPITAKTAKA